MADIDVSSSRCAGYVVVVLRGELDIRQATPLARALLAAAASGSPVIVDLGGLTVADCSTWARWYLRGNGHCTRLVT